jgi:hypothetical protein
MLIYYGGIFMKFKSLIVLTLFLCAIVATVPALGHLNDDDQKCKIIPADGPQVRIHESHDWRLYHNALNHTKSSKVIKVIPAEEE